MKPTRDSYYLTMDGEPAPEAEIKSKKDAAARQALAEVLKEHPNMGVNKLRDVLKARGHGRGSKWITIARAEILGTGAVLIIGLAHTPQYTHPTPTRSVWVVWRVTVCA